MKFYHFNYQNIRDIQKGRRELLNCFKNQHLLVKSRCASNAVYLSRKMYGVLVEDLSNSSSFHLYIDQLDELDVNSLSYDDKQIVFKYLLENQA
jgi:hypothetical protein